MKRISLLITFILLFGAFSIVSAQGGPPSGGQAFGPPPTRPNLLQELGLTRDQVQQLRRLNASENPRRTELQRNLKQANEALDTAIYADDASDEVINERVKAVQQAQADLISHRAFMETSIRKILTKPQLIKFRELRQSFQKRQGNPNKTDNPNRPGNQDNRPLRRNILRPNQRPAI